MKPLRAYFGSFRPYPILFLAYAVQLEGWQALPLPGLARLPRRFRARSLPRHELDRGKDINRRK